MLKHGAWAGEKFRPLKTNAVAFLCASLLWVEGSAEQALYTHTHTHTHTHTYTHTHTHSHTHTYSLKHRHRHTVRFLRSSALATPLSAHELSQLHAHQLHSGPQSHKHIHLFHSLASLTSTTLTE